VKALATLLGKEMPADCTVAIAEPVSAV
jgi:hypothetical protein